MKTGIELITEERQRQIDAEGWTPEHDDKTNTNGELARAASCYVLAPWLKESTQHGLTAPEKFWPFPVRWWRPVPQDRVRELQKAGALIAAEIDRLQRKREGLKR